MNLGACLLSVRIWGRISCLLEELWRRDVLGSLDAPCYRELLQELIQSELRIHQSDYE